MTTDNKITDEVVTFVAEAAFSDFTAESVRIAKRCILDGLGLMLAGSTQDCTRIVREFSRKNCHGSGATAFGEDSVKLPPALAALVNGTSGHAMDWDDTQLSTSPDRTFGLLTHPTIPPLAASMAAAEMLGGVSGREFFAVIILTKPPKIIAHTG